MTNRTGWKLFFVLTVIYLLLGVFSLIQATQQPVAMTNSEIAGWLFMLAFAVLTAIASYGYAWRKIIGFGKFWYLLLAAALLAVIYEGTNMYQSADTDSSEKLFVAIVGLVYFGFFSRLMLNYAAEDHKS
ncbi:hypothetical protein [Rheinheimera muenzenbergensis]